MQKGFKNLFGPFCPRILLLLPPRLFYHILCPYLRGQDLQEILSLLVRVTRFARNLVTFGPERLQEMKGYKIGDNTGATNLLCFEFSLLRGFGGLCRCAISISRHAQKRFCAKRKSQEPRTLAQVLTVKKQARGRNFSLRSVVLLLLHVY